MPSITINLMKNAVYPNIKKGSLEVGNTLGHDLSVMHGRTVVQKSPKFVRGLGLSVGVALFGLNKKFIAHSTPELDNPDFVRNFISKKIYELRMDEKSNNKDVTALIYGGVAYDSDNSLSEDSCRLVDAIEEGCELEGVTPNIISGQFTEGSNTNLDSYIGKNQITIWGKLIDKIKSTQNATSTEIQKILEEFFEYVKLSNNVNVNIIDGLPDRLKNLVK